MISPLFKLVAKERARRRPRRPKTPDRAERLYVGAMRQYAEGFRKILTEEIKTWHPELVSGGEPTRQDAAGPFRIIENVRLRLSKLREKLPFAVVGAEVADHAMRESEALIGLKNADLFARPLISGWRKENVDLVTKMSESMLDRLREELEAYDGQRVEETASRIEQVFGTTRARAELIARDQTLKLNSQMAQESQKAAGVTHYRWSTSHDASVRRDVKDRGDPDHASLDGKIFSWDEPPVTCEKTGARNHPGEDFQCRCVAIPVLEEFED